MQKTSPPAISPAFVLGIGIAAVSTASILIRFAQQEAPSLVIAAMRLTIAAIILAPYVLTRHIHEFQRLAKIDWVLIAVSGMFLAFHFATWISSLEFTSVASSVVLVTTTPLWVAILSPVLLKERISRNVAIGLVLALAGGVIVSLGNECQFSLAGVNCQIGKGFFARNDIWGNLLALAGAFCATGYLLIGRKVRKLLSAIAYVFLVYSIAGATLLFWLWGRGLSVAGYPIQIYLLFLSLAVFPQLIGHSSFNWALGYLPASAVSIALLGEPVGTVILSFLILSETPTVAEAFGGLLILAGIYLAVRSQK